MNSLSLLSDAKYFDESSTKFAEIRNLLDSREIKEKLEAMKRLLAMMTMGKDVSCFFADVVKNVIVENIEVKKLVYMYLVNYADHNQDLALLSINTFQRDLTSPSQRVRANAMRAMASIRVPVVVPLVVMALKSASKDSSVYVRRAAATAVPKIYNLDDTQLEVCMEVIQELLTNNEPSVLGAALFAFNEVCPHNLELVHPHFRKCCHLLADFDEWGQMIALNVLTRYARYNFSEPPGYAIDDVPSTTTNTTVHADFSALASPLTADQHAPVPAAITAPVGGGMLSKYAKAANSPFYSDDEEEASAPEDDDDDIFGFSSQDKNKNKTKGKNNTASSKKSNVVLPIELLDDIPGGPIQSQPLETAASAASTTTTTSTPTATVTPVAAPKRMDPDLAMLLRSAAALLHSPSSGVVVAVAALYQAVAPRSELPALAQTLVRHSRNTRAISFVVLSTIVTLSAKHPALFKPYLHDFFVSPTDSRYIRELKLDLLARLVDESNAATIVGELQAYCRSPDKDVVCRAAQTLGRVAHVLPRMAAQCLRILIALADSPCPAVAAQALASTRILLQRHAADVPLPVLRRLCRLVDTTTEPNARAILVWMVGEHRAHIPTLAPDVLRVLASSFAEEAPLVKQQVLTLAVKLYLADPPRVALLFKYVMDLCKYDAEPDIRDRARMLRTLFFKRKGAQDNTDPAAKEALKALLAAPRPVPLQPVLVRERDKFSLGTLSHAVAQRANGYASLPPFPARSTDPAIRNPVIVVAQPSVAVPTTAARASATATKTKTKSAAPAVLDSFYDDSESESSEEESESESEDSDSEEEPAAAPVAATQNFFGSGADFFAGAATGGFDSFFNAPAASPNTQVFDMPMLTSPEAKEALGEPATVEDGVEDVFAEAVAELQAETGTDGDYDMY